MKDRLSKYPGRVKLTPVDGQADTFDMIRADEPEEAGTPINKNSLLKDETAEAMGLDPAANPTPDDALKKIMEKYEPKVGDVRETVRDDLGENWILCNGEIVPEGEFPALREKLFYNTEWRRIYPIGEYSNVRALPKPGQWFFVDYWNARSYVSSAFLYDANMETWTTITCPSVSTSYYRAIFGLTWDGSRYILGVTEDSAAEAYTGNVFLFTSTDLKNWTQKYKFALTGNSYLAYDLTFDGTNILFMEHASSDYQNQSYSMSVHSINSAMTQKTKLVSSSNTYSFDFSPAPSGYWAYRVDGGSTYVYKAGAKSSLFAGTGGSYGTGIAYFSNKYWVAVTRQDKTCDYLRIYDVTANTISDIRFDDIQPDQYISRTYMVGDEYDPNTREWVFYVQNRDANNHAANYALRISKNGDPRDITQYRSERIDKLPDSLYDVPLTADNARLYHYQGEAFLRDPNLKYLPSHDGDTYKYIYKGVDET